MYSKILVVVDGSELSENVLSYARSFAKALGIPVALLQVLIPETLVPSVVAQHDLYHNIFDGRDRGYPGWSCRNCAWPIRAVR